MRDSPHGQQNNGEILCADNIGNRVLSIAAGLGVVKIYGSAGLRNYRSTESRASSVPAVYVGVLRKV